MATVKIDISGSDIHIGKTVIAAIIVNALHDAGIYPVKVECQDGDLINKANKLRSDPAGQQEFVAWFNTKQHNVTLIDYNGNKQPEKGNNDEIVSNKENASKE